MAYGCATKHEWKRLQNEIRLAKISLAHLQPGGQERIQQLIQQARAARKAMNSVGDEMHRIGVKPAWPGFDGIAARSEPAINDVHQTFDLLDDVMETHFLEWKRLQLEIKLAMKNLEHLTPAGRERIRQLELQAEDAQKVMNAVSDEMDRMG
ncbi:hypothetical protein OC835_000892 [Tilletia horrida]|nr:hypothetical protein OC835_000892 [Tilletia horrida]